MFSRIAGIAGIVAIVYASHSTLYSVLLRLTAWNCLSWVVWPFRGCGKCRGVRLCVQFGNLFSWCSLSTVSLFQKTFIPSGYEIDFAAKHKLITFLIYKPRVSVLNSFQCFKLKSLIIVLSVADLQKSQMLYISTGTIDTNNFGLVVKKSQCVCREKKFEVIFELFLSVPTPNVTITLITNTVNHKWRLIGCTLSCFQNEYFDYSKRLEGGL